MGLVARRVRGTYRAPRSLSGEAFLGQRTIAQLGTFVVGHDADDRPELGEHPLALRVGERARGLDVEGEFRSGRSLVGVLASRAA